MFFAIFYHTLYLVREDVMDWRVFFILLLSTGRLSHHFLGRCDAASIMFLYHWWALCTYLSIFYVGTCPTNWKFVIVGRTTYVSAYFEWSIGGLCLLDLAPHTRTWPTHFVLRNRRLSLLSQDGVGLLLDQLEGDRILIFFRRYVTQLEWLVRW